MLWTAQNEAHVQANGVGIADVEHVIRNPVGSGISRSSGRPFVVGYAQGQRTIIVVYEEIDAMTVYPIAAYVLEE